VYQCSLSAKHEQSAKSDFEKGIVRGVVYAVTDKGTVLYLIEYYSASDRKNRVTLHSPRTGYAVNQHWCRATTSKKCCRHMAYGPLAEKIYTGDGKIKGLTVELKENKEPDISQLDIEDARDISEKVLGCGGEFTILEKLLKKGGREKEEKPVKVEKPPKAPVPELVKTEDLTIIMQNERVSDYLKAQKISEGLRVRVLNERTRRLESMDKKLAEYVVTSPAKLYQGKKELTIALTTILKGKNLFLIGPKGTGKNVLIETLSWCMGLSLVEVNGHSAVDQEQLIGSREVRGSEGGLETYTQLGQIARAMENGQTLVIDEVTGVKPEVLLACNAPMDHRRHLEVPGHGLVKAHPDFRVIWAGNIGYEGLYGVNEATVDRTVVLDLPYHSQVVKKLIKEQTGLKDEDVIRQLAELFDEMQDAARSGKIEPRGVSLRGILDAADLIAEGIPPREALRATVSNKLLEPKTINPDRELLDDLIDSRFAE